jgi:hypothetical protein
LCKGKFDRSKMAVVVNIDIIKSLKMNFSGIGVPDGNERGQKRKSPFDHIKPPYELTTLSKFPARNQALSQ